MLPAPAPNTARTQEFARLALLILSPYPAPNRVAISMAYTCKRFGVVRTLAALAPLVGLDRTLDSALLAVRRAFH